MASALGKPLNVLAPMVKGATVAELAEAGAKRLSVGGALARAALTALLRASEEMRDGGTFGWASGLVSSADVSRLFGAQS